MTDVIDVGINFAHPDAPQQPALPTHPEESQQGGGVAPSAPLATPASQSEPPRKYAGKYTSVEELERGYWNSAQEAQRIAAENKLLKELAAANQRANPAERVEARNEYQDELRDAAIPVEALEKLIEDRANRIVQKAFEPIVRGAQARNEMTERYPEFATRERELQSFLSARPDVNDKYNRMMAAGLEDAAMEYAFLALNSGQPRQTSDASGQEQAAARATAALTGNAVGARDVGDSFSSKLEAARARFERDGDERALAAIVLAGIHPDVHPAR